MKCRTPPSMPACLPACLPSQPALFVAGLAAVERLRADNPAAVESCSATAGLSLGEYTALVFGGALSFEDGLKVRDISGGGGGGGAQQGGSRTPQCVAKRVLSTSCLAPSGEQVVKVRAESMAAAAKQGKPHGMLSVVGLSDAGAWCAPPPRCSLPPRDCWVPLQPALHALPCRQHPPACSRTARADLESICTEVRSKMPDGTVCQMANYLFPQGRVVSGERASGWAVVHGGARLARGCVCALGGPPAATLLAHSHAHTTRCRTGHKEALEEAQRLATSRGALKAVAVAVSGAFHTSLMQPARDALTEVGVAGVEGRAGPRMRAH